MIADKDYFLDAEGNMTTDSSKADRWLARKGTAISVSDQEQYGIKAAKSNPAQTDDIVEDEVVKKASAPKSDKSEKPRSNKGAKKNGK